MGLSFVENKNAANDQFRCSVILPAHNAEATVAEAIRSVVRQDQSPIELIVIDDESTDSTVSEVNKAIRDVPFSCQLIRLNECKHAGAARNRGVANALGDYVAFLDSDDAWAEDHLASAAQAFENHAEAVAYCSRVEIRKENEWTCQGRIEPADPGYVPPFAARVYRWLLSGNSVWNTTLCVKKDAFQTAGGYHESLRCYEDLWMTLNVARQGTFVFCNRIGCLVRTRSSSLSGQADKHGRVFMSPSMYSDRLSMIQLMRSDSRFTPSEIQVASDATSRFVSENLSALCRAREFREVLRVSSVVAKHFRTQPTLTATVLMRSICLTARVGVGALAVKYGCTTGLTKEKKNT